MERGGCDCSHCSRPSADAQSKKCHCSRGAGHYHHSWMYLLRSASTLEIERGAVEREGAVGKEKLVGVAGDGDQLGGLSSGERSRRVSSTTKLIPKVEENGVSGRSWVGRKCGEDEQGREEAIAEGVEGDVNIGRESLSVSDEFPHLPSPSSPKTPSPSSGASVAVMEGRRRDADDTDDSEVSANSLSASSSLSSSSSSSFSPSSIEPGRPMFFPKSGSINTYGYLHADSPVHKVPSPRRTFNISKRDRLAPQQGTTEEGVENYQEVEVEVEVEVKEGKIENKRMQDVGKIGNSRAKDVERKKEAVELVLLPDASCSTCTKYDETSDHERRNLPNMLPVALPVINCTQLPSTAAITTLSLSSFASTPLSSESNSSSSTTATASTTKAAAAAAATEASSSGSTQFSLSLNPLASGTATPSRERELTSGQGEKNLTPIGGGPRVSKNEQSQSSSILRNECTCLGIPEAVLRCQQKVVMIPTIYTRLRKTGAEDGSFGWAGGGGGGEGGRRGARKTEADQNGGVDEEVLRIEYEEKLYSAFSMGCSSEGCKVKLARQEKQEALHSEGVAVAQRHEGKNDIGDDDDKVRKKKEGEEMGEEMGEGEKTEEEEEDCKKINKELGEDQEVDQEGEECQEIDISLHIGSPEEVLEAFSFGFNNEVGLTHGDIEVGLTHR